MGAAGSGSKGDHSALEEEEQRAEFQPLFCPPDLIPPMRASLFWHKIEIVVTIELGILQALAITSNPHYTLLPH